MYIYSFQGFRGISTSINSNKTLVHPILDEVTHLLHPNKVGQASRLHLQDSIPQVLFVLNVCIRMKNRKQLYEISFENSW